MRALKPWVPLLGLIAPGYRADLVLWTGDPLELTSWARWTMIEKFETAIATPPSACCRRGVKVKGSPGSEGLITMPGDPHSFTSKESCHGF